jgi:hypothetical protein
MQISFGLLADYPHFIPEIAGWYFNQWGYEVPGNSLQKTVERIHAELNRGKIPLHLVAIDSSTLAGVAQLKIREMNIYPDKEFWLGGVFVNPLYRDRRLASALVQKSEEIAGSFMIETLYLQTEKLDGGLYSRLGWEPVEQVHYNGHEVLVMKKRLTDQPG